MWFPGLNNLEALREQNSFLRYTVSTQPPSTNWELLEKLPFLLLLCDCQSSPHLEHLDLFCFWFLVLQSEICPWSSCCSYSRVCLDSRSASVLSSRKFLLEACGTSVQPVSPGVSKYQLSNPYLTLSFQQLKSACGFTMLASQDACSCGGSEQVHFV